VWIVNRIEFCVIRIETTANTALCHHRVLSTAFNNQADIQLVLKRLEKKELLGPCRLFP
jgi:hypothetical protein